MILGITGGTGSGKTTLLNIIQELGGMVLDCDAIYHQLLQTDSSLLSSIGKRFPGTVENGSLQRKKLGTLVFSDTTALEDLNKITHAAVSAAVEKLLEEWPALAAIDAIALFESGLAQLCDITVAVTAPEDLRVQRLIARDGVDEQYARSRIRAQRPQEEFIKLCDYHLVNDGDQAEFRKKCLAFLTQTGIIEA